MHLLSLLTCVSKESYPFKRTFHENVHCLCQTVLSCSPIISLSIHLCASFLWERWSRDEIAICLEPQFMLYRLAWLSCCSSPSWTSMTVPLDHKTSAFFHVPSVLTAIIMRDVNLWCTLSVDFHSRGSLISSIDERVLRYRRGSSILHTLLLVFISPFLSSWQTERTPLWVQENVFFILSKSCNEVMLVLPVDTE